MGKKAHKSISYEQKVGNTLVSQMTTVCPINLTSARFELLNEVIPESKLGGRPREVNMEETQNLGAIRYRRITPEF